MLNLSGTPYMLEDDVEKRICDKVKKLDERVGLLRTSGKLTEETIKYYYGEKRFEQVAESNAIEGNTLSVGETELAVLKGITFTGHDPAFVRDAIALDKALQRLIDLSKEKVPTNLDQVLELHQLILGDRPGGGIFRKEPVRIKGSKHIPPKDWRIVMEYMEQWGKWSQENITLPAPIRAIVLHSWLSHIHPFIDGNGRTARAISNLELVRAGYPPIIIRKKDRDRYIDALSESDAGGNIAAFFEFILLRIEGALTGLEISATKHQGYNQEAERIRRIQESKLQIWMTSIKLFTEILHHKLMERLAHVNGRCSIKLFDDSLDLDDYIALCERKSVPETWSFIINIAVPGLERIERLAWIGYRSPMMYHHLNDTGGPSLYWSVKNPAIFPKWITDDSSAPKYVELTTVQGSGDEWYVRDRENNFSKINTTQLADEIAHALLRLVEH